MYEGDAPLAERRAQALTIDRDLLAELLGSEELRELLDPEAIARLELELQGLEPHRFPRDPDEAVDLLHRLGDLSAADAEARGIRGEWLPQLEAERRAVRIRIGNEERWIAAEDAGRYRDALGASLPPGLPQAFLEPVANPVDSLLLRWARTHVPFFSADAAGHFALHVPEVEAALHRLAQGGDLVSGEFRPGRLGHEYSHVEVLRSLRRLSLARLRREVEPLPATTLARFLPEWQGVGSTARGLDRLAEVIAQLQGTPIPVSVLERDVLPARMRDYGPQQLDQLIAMGEVVWVGRGALGASDGRVSLYLRGDAGRLIALPAERPATEVHQRLRDHLRNRGASFFRDLFLAAGGGTDEDVLQALWDLVWAGEVTNDTFLPLRMLGPRIRRSPRRPLMRLGPPGSAGRWSLVADLVPPSLPPTERLHAQAMALLQRHGVLTREAAVGEGLAGGFAAIYPVLRAMEESGKIRRGYFLEGLGGSQFAPTGAVDRLRAIRETDGATVALAASDPANAYGLTLPWPESRGRLARVPGAYVVLDAGQLKLYLERGGRALVTFGPVELRHLQALAERAAHGDKLEIQLVDGAPIKGSAVEPLLRESGFGASPKGLVLWPPPRSLASVRTRP
jgi:ATP-dependent Lhr-like helicase